MPDIDLTKVFQYIGTIFVRGMRTRISERRVDIAGKPFSLIAPSTAAARARILGANPRGPGRHQGPFFNRNIGLTGKLRKRRATSVPVTRLLFTGRFAKGAFQYRAQADQVTVYVTRGNYPVHWTQQPVSFSDIVRFNNQGSPELNPHIKLPPLIFPNRGRDDQLHAMDEYKKAKAFISSPALNKQITDTIVRKAFRKVSVMVKV
jgi:hypothetical protein